MLATMPSSVTPLARTVLDRLVSTYSAAADPANAVAMRAYMRDQFPFLGIKGPQQRVLSRAVLAGLPRPAEEDLRDVALGAWALPEREYQYFVLGWLRRWAPRCSAGFITTAEHLIVTRSWWDTVDALASHVVGPLVRAHPELVDVMDSWIRDENLWRIRTALLHQLLAKEETDTERLFAYCTAQAEHRDFFVRKAIGWALRDYAKTDPAAVRAYVRTHTSRLSTLSVREAMKNL
jgi:3-methyladenine DNA glycosylase AlkD